MDFSIFSKYVDIVKIGWSWAKNLLLFSTETSIFCLLLIFMILTFFNSVFQDGIFGTHLTVHSSSILVHCRTSQDKQYSTSTDYMRQNGTGPKWMIPFESNLCDVFGKKFIDCTSDLIFTKNVMSCMHSKVRKKILHFCFAFCCAERIWTFLP